MSHAPIPFEAQSLYELGWRYAPGGMVAFDPVDGKLIDLNPAAEALSGYSREEVLGLPITILHPEGEWKRVKAEFLKVEQEPARFRSFHIQRKDGQRLPVAISSSRSAVVAGRPVSICVYFDISEQEQKDHQLSTQNWALSAFSIAALALGRAHSIDSLLQSICEAITLESAYALAWIGIAEDGPGKKLRIASSAGGAKGYLDGLDLCWSEDEPSGQGPTGICIRTHTLQILEDSETSPIFAPWRQRARQFGIRSSVSIPLRVEGSLHGALVVYSARPKAFESAPVEVFQHLGVEIVHGI